MKQVHPYLILLIRLLLGGVFVYASLDKIAAPQEFARAIDNYRMIPFGLENTMAIVLPWVELFTGLALIFGFMLDGAALLSAGMAVMFIIAIFQALLRGYNIECGCGLNPGEMVGVGKLVEDLVYLIWAYMILVRREQRFEPGLKSV